MSSPPSTNCAICGKPVHGSNPPEPCPACLMAEALGDLETLPSETLDHGDTLDPRVLRPPAERPKPRTPSKAPPSARRSLQDPPAHRRGRLRHRLHGRTDRPGAPPRRHQDPQGRHGHPPGRRPLRGRAPGARDDGPPEHRQGPRRRRDRTGAPVLRHGAGARHPDHRLLRPREARHPRSASSSSSRSAAPSSTPTRKASSTATSSPATSSSPSRTAPSRCPR